ncbi:hypothetical protein TNCV_401801 [Trichonephila clavipes]|nr:hypothetical protein TNCV_401801 [Trichonephila clavipes]
MGHFTYADNADRHHMYGHTKGKDRAGLRMYPAKFPDRRMPGHSIFQQLYVQLRETRSFHVTRYYAGRQRSVGSPSLEESTLNVGADRLVSSTRAVAHHGSL